MGLQRVGHDSATKHSTGPWACERADTDVYEVSYVSTWPVSTSHMSAPWLQGRLGNPATSFFLGNMGLRR